MLSKISDERISNVFSKALQEDGLIHDDDTTIIFYDLSYLEERIHDLVALFPPSTLHAIAVKANPLTKILQHIQTLGVGLEAATLPELYLAEKAGFPPEKIVFDSPVKTIKELEYALKLGIHINADSLLELQRINELLKKTPTRSTIGIRINPQVGTGTILSTSVAGEFSKFGVPIQTYREELKECFCSYDWLKGVHLHIGSQGCPVEMMVKGIETLVIFVNEVNDFLARKNLHRRIDIFDIGGGLPVSYHRDKRPVSMAQYKAELALRFKELFSVDFRLITEFGRYIYANTGWVASRVEYVKRDPAVNTAMIHVGADLFLRKCYRPEDWYHDVTAVDRYGSLKHGSDTRKYVVAGPLCFSGDMIAKDIELPCIEEHDYLLIHDTGAYTLSMWSRYNSRQIPKVIGYFDDGKRFEKLKAREPIEALWEFWS